MINEIIFSILCFQSIERIISWDLNSPLILNKNGNRIFFPLYANEMEGTIFKYTRPGDNVSSTYTFCHEDNSGSANNSLLGIRLKDDPYRNCESSPMYLRDSVKDSNGQKISCGGKMKNNSGYKMYKAYFDVQINNKNFNHTLYEYCYDGENNLRTWYAYYDLPNPSLLKNKALREEQEFSFESDRLVLEEADRNIYEIYENPVIKISNRYIPCEVAVPEFIPYGHWKRSFYQWQNTAPMNSDLYEPWTVLLNNMRRKLAQKMEPIKIFSGIYGVQRTHGYAKTFFDGKTTVPLIWWILLISKDKTRGISFIMHNYSYDYGEKRPAQLCGEGYCDEAGLNDVLPNQKYYSQTFVYCCPVWTITDLVPIYEGNKTLNVRI